MQAYIIRRLLQSLLLVLLISAIVFAILNLAPGGPLSGLRFQVSAREFDEASRQRYMELLGLDKPVYLRYFYWLGDMVRGDWGDSWTVSTGHPVLGLIKQRLGATLLLTVSAAVISLVLGLIIGVVSAIKQYSIIDTAATIFSFVGISIPTFWFGLMLIVLFAVKLDWLPAGGMTDFGQEGSVLNRIQHMILPVTVLSLINIAGWSRYIRASLLNVLQQDYLRTARAKGLPYRQVITRHALRNALIPLVTLIGLDIPNLFGGAIVTETIFAWPGMGRLYFQSLVSNDYPLAQGLLFVTAVLVVLSNLLADIGYAVVDPRVRLS
jgi:peptide/nickel transport system permease protein